ncbi:MAG: heavy-metal-associated domain-containing protein [Flavobacteriaceae bacterium]|nr:heavy-metal-associated domain-containing protein [Flavobacteriaceae bacterium]
MSLLSENVIPGNHGKTFGTNAMSHSDLVKIKESISHIDGIKDVIIEEDKFPRDFIIHTNTLVSVKEIQDAVIKVGFHAIPKSLFELK